MCHEYSYKGKGNGKRSKFWKSMMYRSVYYDEQRITHWRGKVIARDHEGKAAIIYENMKHLNQSDVCGWWEV